MMYIIAIGDVHVKRWPSSLHGGARLPLNIGHGGETFVIDFVRQ
jgi:hypothetical protein